jgi:hypothetical protein
MDRFAELKRAGKKIVKAKKNLDNAREEAKELANLAWREKMYEVTITEALGVDRMTVRRWLGKQGKYR